MPARHADMVVHEGKVLYILERNLTYNAMYNFIMLLKDRKVLVPNDSQIDQALKCLNRYDEWSWLWTTKTSHQLLLFKEKSLGLCVATGKRTKSAFYKKIEDLLEFAMEPHLGFED